MCRSAGLHADKARRQRLEERQYLAAPKLLPNDDLLAGIDPRFAPQKHSALCAKRLRGRKIFVTASLILTNFEQS